MEHTPLRSFNTELTDRVLWYDGDYSVSPQDVFNMISSGNDISKMFVTSLTPAIEQYNKLVESDQVIVVKENINPLKYEWTFGNTYKQLDVEECVFDALEHEIKGMSKEQQKLRIQRTVKELDLFKRKSFISILQLMIYIVDIFEQKGIVWGVGRGSSVSSYVLFLIGIHDIDSVEFNLPIEDFLH